MASLDIGYTANHLVARTSSFITFFLIVSFHDHFRMAELSMVLVYSKRTLRYISKDKWSVPYVTRKTSSSFRILTLTPAPGLSVLWMGPCLESPVGLAKIVSMRGAYTRFGVDFIHRGSFSLYSSVVQYESFFELSFVSIRYFLVQVKYVSTCDTTH